MIDAHLHLQFPVFDGRRDEIAREWRRLGVSAACVNATEPDDWHSVATLSERFPEVIPFFGIHPWKVEKAEGEWQDRLRSLLREFPSAGVGEIGLDKWIRNADIAKQRETFVAQLRIAAEFDRPVAVHCLQAWGHLGECLDEAGFHGRFLLHSFSGPAEVIDPMIERGAFFSVSGYFLREEKMVKLERFARIPLDRLLLETDSPDMDLPENLDRFGWSNAEGRINHPGNIVAVYDAFAEWRGVERGELGRKLAENFARFRTVPG